MKKIKTISFLSVLFVILQSGGCNNVKELDYIGIQSTSIESINLKNAALRINLEYYNPNKFGIDVKETNLSIYLNDKFVAFADQPERVWTKSPRDGELQPQPN
jgi:LEA14-like dessication related protein